MFAQFFEQRMATAPPDGNGRGRKRRRRRKRRRKKSSTKNDENIENRPKKKRPHKNMANAMQANSRVVNEIGPAKSNHRSQDQRKKTRESKDNVVMYTEKWQAKTPSVPFCLEYSKGHQKLASEIEVIEELAVHEPASEKLTNDDIGNEHQVITTPTRANPNQEQWWSDSIELWLFDKAPRTVKEYIPVIQKLIQFLKGEGYGICKHVKKVKLLHLQQWMKALEDDHKTSDTRRKYTSILKSFWKSLVAHRAVSFNITMALKLPPKSVRLSTNKFLSNEQVTLFLDRAEMFGSVDRCIFGLLYFAGLRVDEVVTIKKDAIKTIRDDNGKNKRLIVTVVGKGSKYREIHIGKRGTKYLRKFIKQLRRVSPNEYLFHGKSKNGHRGKENIYKIVKKYAKHLELDEVSPHWFRHAFATHAFNDGCSIKAISKALGHSSMKTTEKYIQTGDEAGEHIH